MSTIVWLFLAANLVAVVGLAIELSNLREFPCLKPSGGDEEADVYVAMRDEAEHALPFLRAMLAEGTVARVIVADDESVDDTGALLNAAAREDVRVRYLRAQGGKARALAAAIEAYPPQTPWILFTDADVRFEPGAIDALRRHAETHGAAAVSGWLAVDSPSLWSELLGPLVTLVLLQLLPMRAARGTDPRFSAGNGQCFLIRADAYLASGGHAAITDVVEDVALARALKRAGFRVMLASAAFLGAVRGYASLADNVRGLGRSLYYGAGPAGCLIVALWQLALAASPVPLYLARVVTRRYFSESLASLVLAPLGALLGCVLAMWALLAGVRGSLVWRGRELSGGESAART